ncbi:DUF4258 domain-containing protein [Marinobacterium sedimentorum]|uniref:DUF4258 domain-containing protein n=1 Tax=Marinobacterium sedimentorum TaxID=2927804 RepID=UPI0020C5EEFC|nr:DUF4258 domain-containing protein [Marinobacterium sedimentorum]MCP8687133.1 DUF4258 domain-containing protein [Marinobacterium sedimentorum]
MSKQVSAPVHEFDNEQTEELEITEHAMKRMSQRGLGDDDVELTLRYGRKIHARRAVFYVIGRKEIARYCEQEPALKDLDGVQVLMDSGCSTVVTVYRNHDLRCIRPFKRKHRHLH